MDFNRNKVVFLVTLFLLPRGDKKITVGWMVIVSFLTDTAS